MSQDTDNVLCMDLSLTMAEKILAETAEDSSRVIFTYHAEDRMIQRGITRSQVLRCLGKGRITEGPYRDVKGNWVMKIECLSAGEPLNVSAALDNRGNGNFAIIITTYYG